MPLYEYHCRACAHEFEEIRLFVLADEAKCPACGSENVARLASAFATSCEGKAPYFGAAPSCSSVG